MKERLDRAVANHAWCELFIRREILVLPSRTSDHSPLLVRIIGDNQSPRHSPIHRSVKFEASWLADENCMDVIKDAWVTCDEGAVGFLSARERLDRCQRKLTLWSSQKFHDTDHVLKEKTVQLESLQRHENEANLGAIKTLKKEIEIILEHEDMRWKQHAKQSWYKKGDQNTPFFHAWANHRRRVNRMVKIEDEAEREWKKQHEIGNAFAAFFQNLFTTGDVMGVDMCLAGLETRVTRQMNDTLMRTFTIDEVETALNQMHPLKSPGPDGFAACFYQNAWDIVKVEVCQTVLGFLNHDVFDVDLNATYIALIPKIKNPTKVTDYRPISLCNVLYKLISKVLANWLKKVLPHIISPTQSAFIPGRLITDNILVAFEAMYTMDRRMKGREGFMALKLDMSKAYDRVEWGFLEAIMRSLGFTERWIHLLMVCVTTVSYSVLIHGKPYGKITPTRGIRQRDPLSLYLFILCAEGLSSLLYKFEADRKITWLPITRGGTRINHLFFADDSLFFCKANIDECVHIQQVLEIYKKASGQKLNREKTSIFFSKNTNTVVKNHLLSIAGVSSTRRYEKYLGLPSLIGRSRVAAFSGIKSRIWSGLMGGRRSFYLKQVKKCY
jgi:hypothetical protein